MALTIGPTDPEERLPAAHLPSLSLFLHMENEGYNTRPTDLPGFLELSF